MEVDKKKILEVVKERYGQIAQDGSGCCHKEGSGTRGYSSEELQLIPSLSVMGLGCGNPVALARLRTGETVLDLGSGGGIDVFLASRRVGEGGRVIGVDLTEEMIARAKRNALSGGYENVEFRKGMIEALPVEDESVDVVISNCVINLSPDKSRVFKEAYRVLRPDGRLMISDLVTEGELPSEVKNDLGAWAGCIAGAMERNLYVETIRKAGFEEVGIVDEQAYTKPNMNSILIGRITSVKIEAHKPGQMDTPKQVTATCRNDPTYLPLFS